MEDIRTKDQIALDAYADLARIYSRDQFQDAFADAMLALEKEYPHLKDQMVDLFFKHN